MPEPFIVAELSANHLGSLDRALAIVKAAARAGADGFKVQTFTPEQMVGDPGYTLAGGLWDGMNLLDLYREAHTPREWHQPLFEQCRKLGLTPLASPFHRDDVAFLEGLDCPIYKIASFELVDLDLIRTVAATRKPVILSTGMASEAEIGRAVEAADGAESITLLKCTSAYPAPPEEANLLQMYELQMRFGCRVGLSDHTHGIGVATAAAALGAEVIEKHLTLSRVDGGPDAAFSMEPYEFAQMVEECRRAAVAPGQPGYGVSASEGVGLRRSLYFTEDMTAGTVIQRHHVRSARPALGLAPAYLGTIIGERIIRGVQRHQPVTWEVLDAEHRIVQ